jgi:YkoY family integral membrane protein
VLAVLVLGLPKAQQRKALRYGIGGAFLFRSTATVLALHLIDVLWVKLIGAGYLLYLVYRHFGSGASAEERRTPKPASRWMGLPAFWATVVKVELTDLVFAIDSILVAVAMSRTTWVVIAGGILGIIMMRLVIGQLLTLIERYPPLVDAAFVIIAWVSLKLIAEFLVAEGYTAFEIPRWFSLGLIVLIFGLAFLYARREERRVRKRDEAAARLLKRDSLF